MHEPFYEITEWGPLTLILVLLALVVIVAVGVLPRRRKPGFLKYLEQTIALVLVSVLALLAVGLKLNADNIWYASWADLLGGNAVVATPGKTYGAPQDSVKKPAAATHAVFSSVQRNPLSNPQIGARLDPNNHNGQWVSFDFTGSTTGITQKLLVWLPPSYLSHPDQAYPVITAFTGYPGDPATYTQSAHYDGLVMDQVNAKKIREPIVVIPDAYPSGKDTECVDGSGGKYESWLSVDVVHWIKTNLRTVENPQGWATTGFSAGGWCATMLSVRHPQLWPRSINIAGYFTPEYTPGQQWNSNSDPRYDLPSIVSTHKPHVAIWFYTGGQDGGPKRSVTNFHRAVHAPTSLKVTITRTGGHRVDVWTPGMTQSLDWLGATSPYFAARA